MLLTLSLTTLGALLTPGDDPEDWPQFLGPARNASVAATFDFAWPEEGPPVVWAHEIGPGYGGPAVRDGEVYLLDREPNQADVMRVFDLETGDEKWATPYPAVGRLNYPGSRTVPAVDDERVYTCSGEGLAYCFRRSDGEILWNVDMEEVYEGIQPSFGWSASPLLVGDVVVFAPLGEFVGLLALDRKTGEEVWVTEGVGFSHSTPALLNLLGEEQILFLSTAGSASGQDQAAMMNVSSFDPRDGSLKWRHSSELTRLPIPGPIQVDDEHFFVTGGYRGGSALMKAKKEGGETVIEDLYHIDRGAQIHVPLLHEGHVYVLVNENWNDPRPRRKEGGLMCLSLAGEEIWRTGDSPYFGRGSAVLAGDHILIQDGFNGVLRVAKASPAGYQQVAEANLFGIDDRSDHQMWAPMALAGNFLLLRSQDTLLCVEL